MKRGRQENINRTALAADLFPNGRTNRFASALIIWETCNILARSVSLPWTTTPKGEPYYERCIQQGKGAIAFYIRASDDDRTAWDILNTFDLKAACLHLIYAAHATTVNAPWQEAFAIESEQIETYLGLDKRRDLDKSTKLALIESLAQQPCQLCTSLNWSQQGKIPAFTLEKTPIWSIIKIKRHFTHKKSNQKLLTALTFHIQAGPWAQYFLNPSGARAKTAYYQTGILPQALLKAVMRHWQQHEGAARLMLWLLFKLKVGRKQPLKVSTLMAIAYGEEKVRAALCDRVRRKKRIKTFEADLEILYQCGLKPIFDPQTYPLDIQPLWVKLLDLPEDSDAELDFWINDAQQARRLTDPGPRYKYSRLLNARILSFEVPAEWQSTAKPQRSSRPARARKIIEPRLTGTQVKAGRLKKGWSQRQLARSLGKSQSWVRDVENGRLKLKPNLQSQIARLLQLTVNSQQSKTDD
jgi:DNA-binding transcriptional regulator YiaG